MEKGYKVTREDAPYYRTDSFGAITSDEMHPGTILTANYGEENQEMKIDLPTDNRLVVGLAAVGLSLAARARGAFQ